MEKAHHLQVNVECICISIIVHATINRKVIIVDGLLSELFNIFMEHLWAQI
jgi:hypothetical protein